MNANQRKIGIGIVTMHAMLALAALALSACTTKPQQFRGPNGRAAYSMECGSSLDDCYKKAGEACPNGYDIIDRASGTVAIPVYGGGIVAAPQHTLAIECKGSAAFPAAHSTWRFSQAENSSRVSMRSWGIQSSGG